MAIIYDAVLNPTKMELLAQWLPSQPWFTGNAAELEAVGSFRFDDPDGEVGMEIHLVTVDGNLYQVPLTYRGAELQSGVDRLVGTTDHSVLGKRWVYDACADPVFATALAGAVLSGRPQATHFVDTDGGFREVRPSVRIVATGALASEPDPFERAEPDTADGVTTIRTGAIDLSVNRLLDTGGQTAGTHVLTATWDGNSTPVQVASAPATAKG